MWLGVKGVRCEYLGTVGVGVRGVRCDYLFRGCWGWAGWNRRVAQWVMRKRNGSRK